MNSLEFKIIDYVVFIFSLSIPILIGIYYAFWGSKHTSEVEYLYGNKNFNSFLIGLSLFSSSYSAVSVIGVPLEIYYYGTQFITSVLGILIAVVATWLIVLPVFCGNLDIKTPYEYYKLRYNKNVKLLASFIYIIFSILSMPVTLYAPSVTLSQTTGFSAFSCAAGISVVCIFYTTFGGFSAVILIDAFQAMIMLVSYLFVAIAGLYKVGGWNEVMTKAYDGGRIEFLNMDLNPLQRTTFWSTIFGTIFFYKSHNTCSAASLQRYMALKNAKQARISTAIGSIGILSLTLIGALIGLTMYAQYSSCDPVLNKDVQSPNQLLIYFISDKIDYIPGFNGFFIAGLFCGALSTISSVLNIISGIIYYDFVLKYCKTNFAKTKGTFVMKLIVIVNGVLYLAFIPILENSSNVLQLAMSAAGVTYGAILGMLFLGILLPQSNGKGVIAGTLTSIAVMIWINIGAYQNQVNSYDERVLSIENCTNTNFSHNTSISTIDKSDFENIFFLYRISYLYYSLFGTFVTIIIAIIVSYLTRSDIVKNIDPLLVAPFLRTYIQNKISSN